MEYLVIVIIALILIIYRINKSTFDSSESVTGFIKHLIEKQGSHARYHQSANTQSIEDFAELLKKDYKQRMDQKIFKHARWIHIAEEIKEYLDQYMEDIDV